jgi:predicted amidohydrolase
MPRAPASADETPTVAACQIAVDDLDVQRNHETITERLSALPDHVDLAVFPEYALTGFVADDRVTEVALARDAPEIQSLRERAAEMELALTFGFVETTQDRRETQETDDPNRTLYNATAYVAPDGDLTVYRKQHLWAGERRVLEAGDSTVTVETPLGRAGIVTCYDLNFVERSAELARPEVDALLVGGAWPAAYSENWRLLLRARALDGVRWVVGAGRTGEKRLPDAEPTTYAGRSMVTRPDGGVHRELDRQERTLVTDLDPAILADQREIVGIFE